MSRDSQRFRKTYSYHNLQPKITSLEIIVDETLDFKHSVRVATTSGSPVTFSGATPTTIDGITLANEDRVLLKDQASASQNGIYYYEVSSDGGSYSFVRASDARQGTLDSGAFTYVEEGSIGEKTSWVLTTKNPITIDVTALTWELFGAAGGSVASIFTTQGSKARTTYNTSFDSDNRYVDSIGSDVAFFVSGSSTHKAVFGGDIVGSGSLVVNGSVRSTSLTGSLTNIADGTSYLVAGSNVTITTGSNGAVTIGSTAGGGGGGANTKYARLSYGTTVAGLAYTTTDILWTNSGELSTGISVTNGSAAITIANAGVYDISFRGQVKITAGVAPWQIWMFLQVDSGAGRVNVVDSGAYEIYNNIYQRGSAGFRRLINFSAGDILYVCFQVSHTGVFFDPVTPGSIPSSPAVELNIVSVTI